MKFVVPIIGAGLVFGTGSTFAQPPRTVAERTNYEATSRHAEVVGFCKDLAKASPLVRVAELGTTDEGRTLPLVILADPAVATPDEG